MAGHPIGEKAPIGNTDCPIGYGLYPLASFASEHHQHPIGDGIIPPLYVGGGVENVRVHVQPSKLDQRTILTPKKK